MLSVPLGTGSTAYSRSAAICDLLFLGTCVLKERILSDMNGNFRRIRRAGDPHSMRRKSAALQPPAPVALTPGTQQMDLHDLCRNIKGNF